MRTATPLRTHASSLFPQFPKQLSPAPSRIFTKRSNAGTYWPALPGVLPTLAPRFYPRYGCSQLLLLPPPPAVRYFRQLDLRYFVYAKAPGRPNGADASKPRPAPRYDTSHPMPIGEYDTGVNTVWTRASFARFATPRILKAAARRTRRSTRFPSNLLPTGPPRLSWHPHSVSQAGAKYI